MQHKKGLLYSGTLTPEEQVNVRAYKHIALLSYFFIGFLYVYFVSWKKSSFALYHARQGMVLFVLFLVLAFFPYIGPFLGAFIVILALIAMFQVHLGNYFNIPLIGDIVSRSSFLANTEQLLLGSNKIIGAIQKAHSDTAQSEVELSSADSHASPQIPPGDTPPEDAPVEDAPTEDTPPEDTPQWE